MQLMTKLLTFIIIIFFFACKERPNQTLLVNNQTVQEKGIQNNKIYNSCEEAIIDIVKSSNALALKNFKNIQIRINNLTSEKISIELYVSNDISESSAEKKVAENSVGWLEFFPLTKKLQDITNDPESPELLKYDITILEKKDISKLCGLVRINSNNTNQNNIKCYRKENNNYSFKEICEYSGVKDFNFLYSQIAGKFQQDDLLKALPKKDTIYSTLSTPEVKYSIKKDLITINITSEGGNTVLKIYETKDKGFIEATKLIN